MTEDQFNKATSARDKRLMERLEKTMAEHFSKLVPKAVEPTEEEEESVDAKPVDKSTATPAPNDATASELKRLRKRLEASEKEREAEKKAREEQSAKSALAEERAKLGDALTAANVDSKWHRAAMALLHTEDKRVRRNAEGKVIFLDDDGDEMELGAGLKHWLTTDDGKKFVPARGASGSGAVGGKAPINLTDKKGKRADAANALVAAMLGRTPT
jgi:hypothetical protein